jgi:hypothetical protein
MAVDEGLQEVAAAGGSNPPRAAAALPRPGVNDGIEGNNNANAGQGDGQQQEELPLLHSLEHYIRTRGIAPVDEQAQQADVFYSDSHHARKREVEGSKHQESAHRAAFAEHDSKEQDEKASKRRFLDTLKGQTIEVFVMAKDEESAEVASCGSPCTTSISSPLDVLAAVSDTVYTMVRSERTHWSRQSSALTDVENVTDEKTTRSNKNNWHPSTLDLTDFRSGSVESFLSLAADAAGKDENAGVSLANVPSHHIVDVCLMSHYLQCNSVLEVTIAALKESVDSDNCLSMCQLADLLASPSLFEASVTPLIEKLDDIQEHEEWDAFPVTLRNRVITMRNAVRSSIIGRGQKTSVFFSSSDEFLAIFSDNIREQRERLAEAKRRQEQIISDRIQNPGGRHRDPYGGSVKDAEIKIERQERRLQTLEAFYKEQKQIFAGGSRRGLGASIAKMDLEEKEPFRLGYS